jgi:23S rRNA (cytidine1920-2'-O)/16S rRNA (cytidine1409-2'-O)-methyltransferase
MHSETRHPRDGITPAQSDLLGSPCVRHQRVRRATANLSHVWARPDVRHLAAAETCNADQDLEGPGRTLATTPPMKRQRADQALVERGLAESRTRAQALILAGKVFSGDRPITKAGEQIAPETPLAVRGQDHPWVSRGGIKLDHALNTFALSPAGRICLDMGASTGGFTDVLLARGATRVHAVDVGQGQLAWQLRTDPRVVVHEKTNARTLTPAIISDPIQALVCDASFIGLATLLPAPLSLCAPGAWAVALIKPQFEAGRAAVGSKGVVRDPAVHTAVCERVHNWWNALPGWRVLGIEPSPILGPEGNREFLIASVKEA